MITREDRNKIIATVIVGLLGAFLIYLGREWIPAAWNAIWQFFAWIFTSLGQSVTVPRWWHWFLLVNLAVTVIVWFAAALAKSQRPPELTTDDYVEDVFLNVVWRWRGRGPDLLLVPFCLSCDRQLIGAQGVRYGCEAVELRCQNCGGIVLERDGNRRELEAAVCREIDLKYRNGDWKQAIQRAASRKAQRDAQQRT